MALTNLFTIISIYDVIGLATLTDKKDVRREVRAEGALRRFGCVISLACSSLQWRNWLAHGTYKTVFVSNAGVVSSSLTWSIFFY